MATRSFNTAYLKLKTKKELELKKRKQDYDRQYESLNAPHSKTESVNTSINDLLKFMELMSQTGVFQSFDPRDFGADYDIVPIPKDGTPEAKFWLNEQSN